MKRNLEHKSQKPMSWILDSWLFGKETRQIAFRHSVYNVFEHVAVVDLETYDEKELSSIAFKGLNISNYYIKDFIGCGERRVTLRAEFPPGLYSVTQCVIGAAMLSKNFCWRCLECQLIWMPGLAFYTILACVSITVFIWLALVRVHHFWNQDLILLRVWHKTKRGSAQAGDLLPALLNDKPLVRDVYIYYV